MQMIKWQELQIKDIGRVITGRTPPTEISEYFGMSIPFITPSDMDEQRVVDSPQRWLSDAGANFLSRNIITKGVAVSCIGWQMGKSIMINRPSITNQQLNTIIPNEKIVDCLFLYYS